jgi:von Willebrand factor type A domain-containing protein
MVFAGAALVAAAAVSSNALAKRQPPAPPAQQQQGQAQGPRPKIEVVFVLDTTGSMSGLIQGAKDKIWSIAHHIATGQPKPDVKIGLVAYRDRGDVYVTKKFALTGDLDAVFQNLQGFQADGGGDTPEHVAKGLYDAVYGMDWSKDSMKMVFLVGDAPPHTDYNDGFDYEKIVKEAHRREIRVHAIRCGTDPSTEIAWQKIARIGSGMYASIAETGGVVSITTPHDAELADLGRKLNDTAIIVGGDEDRRRVAAKAEGAARADAPAAADRASYYAVSGAGLDEKDALAKPAAAPAAVAAAPPPMLPAEMRTMSTEEKKAYVTKKAGEREHILRQMNEVAAKRDAYIRAKQKEAGPANAFDDVVDKAISEQAKDYGVKY